MAGYFGYSKSNNAVQAECDGLLPLSRISGAPKWAIKIAGSITGPEEWHHTSKFYNKTYYYDVEKILSIANSLVTQYEKKSIAENEIKSKRSLRRKNNYRGDMTPTRYFLPCSAWTREIPARCAGVSLRELVKIMRDRGLPMTMAARNKLAIELADLDGKKTRDQK